MAQKSLFIHAGVFVLSALLALRAWTRDETTDVKDVAAELWGGSAKKVERVEFESKKRKVVLEASSDEEGQYFVTTVEKTKISKHSGDDPHAHLEPPDLGDPTAVKETQRFISAKSGTELVEKLAPLAASRVLGKIEEARLAEFGFDQDHGTFRVVIGGKTHELTIGGETPGGSDVYVRDPHSGEAYVISGKITDALKTAEGKLMERDFHAFAPEDVEQVRIIKGDKTRELTKHAEQKGFWANPATPDQKDETASNWMTKLERLRVTSYVENPEPPVAPEELVIRVEFLGRAGKVLGFLEVFKRPKTSDADPAEYVARSEGSRWYASVLRSAAEQVENDVGSVLNQ